MTLSPALSSTHQPDLAICLATYAHTFLNQDQGAQSHFAVFGASCWQDEACQLLKLPITKIFLRGQRVKTGQNRPKAGSKCDVCPPIVHDLSLQMAWNHEKWEFTPHEGAVQTALPRVVR